ncbi:hypothetical protein PST407_02219 [Pseudomonas syringae pv. tomato]|nr:hypothetical protein PST407_02219 [Pseudomonas syringae pv. tomato]
MRSRVEVPETLLGIRLRFAVEQALREIIAAGQRQRALFWWFDRAVIDDFEETIDVLAL